MAWLMAFRFEELDIWKDAIKYANRCYRIAESFPKKEMFALADQLRRASVSIPTNIAEGSGGSDREFNNFLGISIRSALETVSILVFAEKEAYIAPDQKEALYAEAEILVKKIRAFRRVIVRQMA
jgi:four helix bundle protein